ncbi:MAG: septal ring lytic transglycosylase RlpA family protein [Rhodocyclaceae bacterium]|nr:septal ring lytic transglycosylase RlpA family protein [Rhodocyclaceae bacterium]
MTFTAHRPLARLLHPRVLALLAAALLTACGSAPSRTGGGKSSGGGGYYKDDGPADYIPVDLDKVPDAVPRIEPLNRNTLRPYTVMGKHYVPFTDFRPYRERGTASWYGKKFHGNTTSSGERYDMFAMTAAHPTLPLPSYARVTNLNNGRSVVVRVNDRGPFLHNRIMDLSYVAAYRLGYVNSGSAPVEVEAILPDEIRLANNAARNVGAAQSAPVAPPPDPFVATLPPVPVRPPASIEIEPLIDAPPSPAVPIGTPIAAGQAAAPPAPTVSTPIHTTPQPAAAPAPMHTPVGAPQTIQMTTLPADIPAAAPDAPSAVALTPISPPAPATPPAPAMTGMAGAALPAMQRGTFIQLGAFSSPEAAQSLANRARATLGSLATLVRTEQAGAHTRVQVGPFASREEALHHLPSIGQALGLQPFVVER